MDDALPQLSVRVLSAQNYDSGMGAFCAFSVKTKFKSSITTQFNDFTLKDEDPARNILFESDGVFSRLLKYNLPILLLISLMR